MNYIIFFDSINHKTIFYFLYKNEYLIYKT